MGLGGTGVGVGSKEVYGVLVGRELFEVFDAYWPLLFLLTLYADRLRLIRV